MTKVTIAIQYDVHPGVAMIRKWADELPAKTGRTLDEWGRLVTKQKFDSKSVATDWLKTEYGLGTMTAGQVVEYAMGQQTWDGTPEIYLRNAANYVNEMFVKGKEWQRPIFEEVVAFVRTLGSDVKICPCKTIVPFYRTRVFGELKPATKTRLELSFALDEVPDSGRLIRNPRAKGNDRLRQMIALSPDAGFDSECKKWLMAAYRADA